MSRDKIESHLKIWSAIKKPNTEIIAAISNIETYLAEEIFSILPSTKLGTLGVELDSLICVSNNYLIELKLNKDFDFDIGPLRPIHNIRFESKFQSFKVGDQEFQHEIYMVSMKHNAGLVSRLTYVCTDELASLRSDWLSEIKKAFPVNLLLNNYSNTIGAELSNSPVATFES